MNCELTQARPRAMSYCIMTKLGYICMLQFWLSIHISNGYEFSYEKKSKIWGKKANWENMSQKFLHWNLYLMLVIIEPIISELNIILNVLHNLDKLISSRPWIFLQSCSFLCYIIHNMYWYQEKEIAQNFLDLFPHWWCVSFQETGTGDISRDWEHW